jgi:hypothetical protein
MLGGTLVTVSGPCFEATDSVECIFGGISTPAVYVNRESVACVSPAMNVIGNVEVVLQVNGIQRSAFFYSIPILRAHGLDVQSSLVVDSRSEVQITWDPSDILPLDEDHSSYTVNVYVYTYDYKKKWWEEGMKFQNLPNNGGATLALTTIQFLIKAVEVVCIHVSAGTVISTSNNVGMLLTSINAVQGIPFPYRAGIWSGLLFSIKSSRSVRDDEARIERDEAFDSICSRWSDTQSRMSLSETFSGLPACPPTQDRAELPNSGLEEVRFDSVLYDTNYHSQWMQKFHPRASKCFTQTIVASGEPGQECCYDDDGNLLVGSPDGGSANLYAPVDFDSYHKYIQNDVIPNVFCCPRTCVGYYDRRPSDDGSNYQPPPPACIYGDPHVITLDGLKYTFNGKGEFTLIEALDNAFTLQGRMVEVQPAPGQSFDSGSPATVFSAIAGKQFNSDTVQFTLNEAGTIDTTINGAQVDFDMLNELSFLNVVIMNKGNATFAAVFSSGAYIEVQSANSFISLLLVSLPSTFMGTTTGLMGSFNGNTDDDLAPKTENGTGNHISSNSSLEDIHTLFGITWIIDSPEDSLFSYRQSLGESWSNFYDPEYNPAFAPTFDDPTLEAQAIEICGDSQFCLFDIAATKRPEIGMTTAVNNEEFDVLVNMSQPVVCDPPCENGACIATNTCMCTQGYIGDTCATPVMTQCEENICGSGGTCQMLAGSIICTCPPHLTGTACDLLRPPIFATDTISDAALMSVPLIVHPNNFGFDDYKSLISLCYEIHGASGQIANLVSSMCTSINARYVRLDHSSAQTTFGSVGIRSVDGSGECKNIQVNKDCSILFNGDSVTTNFTASNISIDMNSDSILVTVPNCGKEIVIKFHCLQLGNTSLMNMSIIRSYIEQDNTHGLIGQFWSASISAESYLGNTTGLIRGYDPYTLTVRHPQSSNDRKFVGVLIPRLWNNDPNQCVYAGNSEGGSTGTGPTAPHDSVIQGEYRDYRVRGLFGVNFRYSMFQKSVCS